MCDHLAVIYKYFAYANTLYAYVWSENGKILSPFVPTIQNIIQCWFIYDMFIPNKWISVSDVLSGFGTLLLSQFGSFLYI